MEKGLVHVYTGDGKGKTTAAFGLAMRCYGAGGNVCVLQFLKPFESGEAAAICALSDARFRVLRFESEHDLVFDDHTELDLEYLKKDILKAYAYALKTAKSGECDLLVLDEILWAHYFKFITLEELLALIHEKSEHTELVLTGRNAPDEVFALADYITNMQAQKHPYNQGIEARKGIEF